MAKPITLPRAFLNYQPCTAELHDDRLILVNQRRTFEFNIPVDKLRLVSWMRVSDSDNGSSGDRMEFLYEHTSVVLVVPAHHRWIFKFLVGKTTGNPAARFGGEDKPTN